MLAGGLWSLVNGHPQFIFRAEEGTRVSHEILQAGLRSGLHWAVTSSFRNVETRRKEKTKLSAELVPHGVQHGSYP